MSSLLATAAVAVGVPTAADRMTVVEKSPRDAAATGSCWVSCGGVVGHGGCGGGFLTASIILLPSCCCALLRLLVVAAGGVLAEAEAS